MLVMSVSLPASLVNTSHIAALLLVVASWAFCPVLTVAAPCGPVVHAEGVELVGDLFGSPVADVPALLRASQGQREQWGCRTSERCIWRAKPSAKSCRAQ
jgi:hypothetical protein